MYGIRIFRSSLSRRLKDIVLSANCLYLEVARKLSRLVTESGLRLSSITILIWLCKIENILRTRIKVNLGFIKREIKNKCQRSKINKTQT